MTHPITLIDTTFSGKDISTASSVYEYSATADRLHYFQVRLASVAGNGTYTVYLTLNDGDAQTDDPIEPKTAVDIPSGETSFWFQTISIYARNGDVVNIFLEGLGGDTSIAGTVRIAADNISLQGSGSVPFTYTVTSDATGLPIDGVDVYATTDYQGSNIVARAYTDAFGEVTFYLDPGTYYFFSSKAGFDFDNPDTEVVT